MRKIIIFSTTLLLFVVLAACASLKLPGTSSESTSGTDNTDPVVNGTPQLGNAFNFENQPLESKLALGTLALEDTELAITVEQAQALLPLWKAVRSLGSNNNASQEELDAVYTQIKETMTASQIQAIEKMKFTQEEMTALTDKLGIQFGRGGNMGNQTEDERATRVAQFQAQGGGAPLPGQGGGRTGGRPGGDFPGGGMPGGGAGAAPDGFNGGIPGQNGQDQATPEANMAGRVRMGISSMFIEPLIQILQERAESGG